jgi:hypothetical protein
LQILGTETASAPTRSIVPRNRDGEKQSTYAPMLENVWEAPLFISSVMLNVLDVTPACRSNSILRMSAYRMYNAGCKWNGAHGRGHRLARDSIGVLQVNTMAHVYTSLGLQEAHLRALLREG